MSPKELIELAVEMRKAQRAFFAGEGKAKFDALRRSKELERQFDREAAKLLAGQGELL